MSLPGTLGGTIFSAFGFCTVHCPDGTPFTYTDTQDIFWGATQADASLGAQQNACRQAPSHQICIGSLPQTIEEGVAFSQVLTAIGFLAGGIFENLWTITGDIPDGMTCDDGFVPRSSGPTLTGTPTTPTSYSLTVRVQNPNGDSQTKNFTITVYAPAATIVPIITTATPVTYFNSGGNYAAGTYRINYIKGALQYGAGTGYSVNYVPPDGFRVVYGGGDTAFPASSATFTTQAQAETANAGAALTFVHSGGPIGMYLNDNPYSDNSPGSPNPTFALTQIS